MTMKLPIYMDYHATTPVDVSLRRGQYMTNIDDWNNHGDADGLKNKVIDVVKDVKHMWFDSDDPAKFEAARLAAFDNEARAIMKTLASAYVAADSGFLY